MKPVNGHRPEGGLGSDSRGPSNTGSGYMVGSVKLCVKPGMVVVMVRVLWQCYFAHEPTGIGI